MLCMKYYNQSQSSRALEMIVQAYWIECYEARIAVIRLENPRYSSTEAKMAALKEACAVLHWKEKDLRNRMYVLKLLAIPCEPETNESGPSGVDTKRSKMQAAGPVSYLPAPVSTASANIARDLVMALQLACDIYGLLSRLLQTLCILSGGTCYKLLDKMSHAATKETPTNG